MFILYRNINRLRYHYIEDILSFHYNIDYIRYIHNDYIVLLYHYMNCISYVSYCIIRSSVLYMFILRMSLPCITLAGNSWEILTFKFKAELTVLEWMVTLAKLIEWSTSWDKLL